MKVLLDECIPRKLMHSLPEHDCETVPVAGFGGKKNGELLRLAEAAGFELLFTIDKGLVAILIVCARSNRLSDLLLLTDSCRLAIDAIKPGELVRVAD